MSKVIIFLMYLFVSLAGSANAQWKATSGPGGGAISGLSINGANLHAVVAHRGLSYFHSTDGGANWTRANTGIQESHFRSFAVKDAHVFIGTADGLYHSIDFCENSTMLGVGLSGAPISFLGVTDSAVFVEVADTLFLSTDNGENWVASDLVHVGGVRACAASGNTILAAGTGPIYRSRDNGRTWLLANTGFSSTRVHTLTASGNTIYAGTSNDGVFLSTDTGSSWTPTLASISGKYMSSLAVHGDTIIVGTYTEGIYISTNKGAGWTLLNSGLPTTSISSVIADGKHLYAGTHSGVYLLAPNGECWTPINAGLAKLPVSSIVRVGNAIYAGTSFGGVFRSTNNGDDWVPNNSGIQYDDYINVHALAAIGDTVFASASSGFYFSTENSDNWSKLDSSPGAITLISSGSTLFAGTYENGVRFSTNSGRSWTHFKFSPSEEVLNIYSLAAKGNEVFAGALEGVLLSTNNGVDWTHIGFNIEDIDVYALALCGNTIFAGTDTGVFLSTDGGFGWTSVTSGIGQRGVTALVSYGNDVFAATKDGELFLSSDQGAHWNAVAVDPKMGVISRFTVIDGTLFAGTGSAGVWKRSLSEMVEVVSDRARHEASSQPLVKISRSGRLQADIMISFDLATSQEVVLTIHDLRGRMVASLCNEKMDRGSHIRRWDARSIATGVYALKMRTRAGLVTMNIPILRQ
jgi:photosystem II stability/assembly factor-like uncharacterized protein